MNHTSNSTETIISQYENCPNPGEFLVNFNYQKRDLEIIDYNLYSLQLNNLDIAYAVRGSQPKSLEAKEYFVDLGSAFTFGCFCPKPYGSLLQEKLGLPQLNLGFAGAGPRFFLKHHKLVEQYVNQAQFAIILVMSGRSESNSLFASGGLETYRRRTDGQYVTAEVVYQELITNYETDYVKKIVEETRNNWVKNYQELLSMITVPKILLWLSKRPPEYQATYDNTRSLFGNFPQLVNPEMMAAIKSYCDEYVECVSKKGSPQLLTNRFNKKTAYLNTREGRVKPHNDYYASPGMHEDAANALEAVCKKYATVPQGKLISIKANQLHNIAQGDNLRAQGKIAEAIDYYHKVISTQVNVAKIHTNLGGLYAQQEQWQEAINHYRKALVLDPSLAIVYRNLARVLEKTDQPEAAMECWYRALNLDSSWATAHDCFKIGYALEEQGKVKPAQVCYRQAIKLQPDALDSYYHLGDLLRQEGEIEEEVTLYRQALTTHPQEAQLYYLIGKSLLTQRKWQEAAEALNEAISREPNLWKAFRQLGEALQKQQRWTEAETVYRRALDIKPKAVKLRRFLAQVLLKQKRWQEAIELSRATLEIKPSLPWAYIHLGTSLMSLGDIVEARKCYQQACNLQGWEACVTKDYQFSQDWFTNQIPVWKRKLKPLIDKENLNVLEIGSYEGMSTCWLLDKVLTQDSATITCIDIYFPPQFDQNIAKTGAKEKVTTLMGNSHTLLATLAENTYDLVYIDGCPQASHVQEDARLCWDLVNAEGIVIFNNYKWQDSSNLEEKTKVGIDDFLKEVEGEFETLYQGNHLIIKKVIN